MAGTRRRDDALGALSCTLTLLALDVWLAPHGDVASLSAVNGLPSQSATRFSSSSPASYAIRSHPVGQMYRKSPEPYRVLPSASRQ